jgi:hypothetical protein
MCEPLLGCVPLLLIRLQAACRMSHCDIQGAFLTSLRGFHDRIPRADGSFYWRCA